MAGISTQMLLAINHGCTVAEAGVAPRGNALRDNFVNTPAPRAPPDRHRFETRATQTKHC
jgi:hypothetical protein